MWWSASKGNTQDSLTQPDTALVSALCLCVCFRYLNKILLGSHQGKLQLWNIRTRKMVFEFEGWGSKVRHFVLCIYFVFGQPHPVHACFSCG